MCLPIVVIESAARTQSRVPLAVVERVLPYRANKELGKRGEAIGMVLVLQTTQEVIDVLVADAAEVLAKISQEAKVMSLRQIVDK